MGLRLVIADSDKEYLNALVEYLANQELGKFYVTSLTEEHEFLEYIKNNENRSDIILIAAELCRKIKEKIREVNFGTVIILTAGDIPLNDLKYATINKYQCGNKIINDMRDIYQHQRGVIRVNAENERAKVIGVFSSQGGVGKTTVAVGLSIQLACEGKAVLYLNLENFPSTTLYFEGGEEKNFSNVLYYLQQQKPDISSKIKGAQCSDSYYGVYFFQPPDSPLDWNEVTEGQLERLLQELKKTGNYDYIVVDLSSSLNTKNIVVLGNCDNIILVLASTQVCRIKHQTLLRNLEIMSSVTKAPLTNKLHYILNCYDDKCSIPCAADDNLLDKEKLIKIPYISTLLLPAEKCYRIDMNCKFGTAMYQLVEDIKTEIKDERIGILDK